MKKVTWLLLVVVLFAAGSTLAQNRGYRNFRGNNNAPNVHKKMHRSESPFRNLSLDDVTRAREELKLSDEQIEELKQLRYDFQLAQVDRWAAIEKAQIELSRLKADRSAPEESILNAIDNLSQVRAELEKARYHFHNQLRSILSEDQLEKWERINKEHRGDFHRQFRGIRSGGFGDFDDDDNDADDE